MKSRRPKYAELESLRHRVLNSVLLLSLIVGVLAFLISLIRVKETGFDFANGVDMLTLSLIFIVYLIRNRMILMAKALTIIFLVFMLIIIHAVQFGVTAPNDVLLIVIAFFSILTMSLKRTLIIYILTFSGFMFVGYLHITGAITALEYADVSLNPRAWILEGILISIVAVIFIVFSHRYGIATAELIKDQKNKNKKLETSQANIKALFDNTDHIIGLFDRDLRLIEYNEAFEEYAKQTDNIELYPGIDVLNKMNRPQAELFTVYLNRALKGEKFKELVEYPIDGSTLYFRLSYNPIKLNGEVQGVSMYVEDITQLRQYQSDLEVYNQNLENQVNERTRSLEDSNEELHATNEELYQQRTKLEKTLNELRKAQSQLVTSEKMASLGVLAAGVAHEINNPLNFIKGGLTAIHTQMNGKSSIDFQDLNPFLQAIDEGVRRSSIIVKSLNHFSRKDDLQNEKCDVNAILDNCLVILNNPLKGRINLVKNYQSGVCLVMGNEGKLHQVFLNILSNAEQAIPGEGSIGIETHVENDHVYVHIKDDGTGIKKEDIHKISDPFFTTKEPGVGTGLGLSITYSIIEEHEGEIRYDSEYGQGTEVFIKLPQYKNGKS